MAEYGKGPSKSDWARHGELLNTGFKGWDVFQRLPLIMKSEIPWMRDFVLGFSPTDDMDTWTAKGWRPMRVDHFGEGGMQTFNETVGLRFNLISVDGTVKFKGHYLMIKPKDMRDEQMRRQNEEFEEYYHQISHQAYVHPRDPRAEEMAEGSTASLDESHFIRQPGQEGDAVKRKIGRPKNT
jgi:hypothetical protein